jgi:murein DD-endopeptidase MepM/ murein hydrolase activator NlpD
MTTIVNNFARPVIAADHHDPYVSWQRHIDQGSLGGVDLAYPKGTPIAAPADGVFRYRKGNGSTLTLDDGSRIEFFHLDSPLVKSGTRVRQGQLIARSGNSGMPPGGGHYAAHLHVHYVLPDGIRVNLWDHFTATREKRDNMEYGVIKGDQKDTCYAYRLANGSLRPLLNRAELGGFLSVGVSIQTVPQGDIAALLEAAPPWFPTDDLTVAASQGLTGQEPTAPAKLTFTGIATAKGK